MKKLNLVPAHALLLGLAISSFAAQKSIEGRWEGTMIREGAALAVSFDFTNDAAGLKAMFDSPTQRAMGIPLRNVRYTTPKVHFELVGDATSIIFDGELTADTIVGQFREGDAKGTLCGASNLNRRRSSKRRLALRTVVLRFPGRCLCL